MPRSLGPKACSSELWTSSVSTSASEVAGPASMGPVTPDTRTAKRGSSPTTLLRTRPTTRRATSAKSTHSSAECASMSCTVAMDAARSIGFAQRAPHLVAAAAPGLHAQQRRDGLQVVLDAVVDLPDGRLLDAQLALAPPRLGEVVDEHQRAGGERDGAVAERAPGDLELRGQGAGGAEHGGDAERAARAARRRACP